MFENIFNTYLFFLYVALWNLTFIFFFFLSIFLIFLEISGNFGSIHNECEKCYFSHESEILSHEAQLECETSLSFLGQGYKNVLKNIIEKEDTDNFNSN